MGLARTTERSMDLCEGEKWKKEKTHDLKCEVDAMQSGKELCERREQRELKCTKQLKYTEK